LHGITAVCFDAVASLFRNQGGGDDPTDIAFFRQIAIEPISTWPGFIDEDEVGSLGLPVSDELVEVTVAGANGPR
jgi:hypothetical protein